MVEKTYMGGMRCPKCGSFVKEGSLKCSVCGYTLNTQERVPVNAGMGPVDSFVSKQFELGRKNDYVTCPKCGVKNPLRAKFCKNCRQPLMSKELSDDNFEHKKDVRKEAVGSLRLNLKWINKPKNINFVDNLNLTPINPFFEGAVEWQGFGIMVYQKGFSRELLIRKVNSTTSSKLFVKMNRGIIVPCGTEFYLGAVGFQLLGTRGYSESRKGSEPLIGEPGPGVRKTVFIGPDEVFRNVFKAGKSRIRILNIDMGIENIHIDDTIVFGRNFLAKAANVDDSLLAELGVSSEHVMITPFEDGSWLLSPRSGRYIYLEIKETPFIFDDAVIVRLVGKDFPPCEGILKIEE